MDLFFLKPDLVLEFLRSKIPHVAIRFGRLLRMLCFICVERKEMGRRGEWVQKV